MANALEQRGFFWWFNEPNRPAHSKETSIPGLLTVTEDGNTTLEIDGALSEDNEHADWSKPRSFPSTCRIAGLLDTPGDYVLLEGVERTDFSISTEGPRKQTFVAETCTQRSFPFPEDYDQNGFVEIRIALKGLEDWLELNSIFVERDYTDDLTVRSHVSYTDHKFSFPASGGTVAIESLTTGDHSLFLSRGLPRREVRFEQSFYIVFYPDAPTDLNHLQYIFSKVEELLSLLLGSYHHLGRPTFVRKEEPFDSWITVFSRKNAPSTQTLNRYFLWVPFRDVREHFGQLFELWLSGSEKFGAGFYLYIASLRNPHVYAEDRLFAFATGIEALHRRCFDSEVSSRSVQEKKRIEQILQLLPEGNPDRKWLAKQLAHAHEPSLESRLLESLRELPFRFGKSELEKFVKACANRRNDISHRGGPSGDMDYNVFHEDTLRLAEALGYLFHLLVLYKIGLPQEILFQIVTKSWVAERHIKPALSAVGLNIRI